MFFITDTNLKDDKYENVYYFSFRKTNKEYNIEEIYEILGVLNVLKLDIKVQKCFLIRSVLNFM